MISQEEIFTSGANRDQNSHTEFTPDICAGINTLYQSVNDQYHPPLTEQLGIKLDEFDKLIKQRVEQGGIFYALKLDEIMVTALMFLPVSHEWLERFKAGGANNFFRLCNEKLESTYRLSMGATRPDFQGQGLQIKLMSQVVEKYFSQQPNGQIVFDTSPQSKTNSYTQLGFRLIDSFNDPKKSRATNCYLLNKQGWLTNHK